MLRALCLFTILTASTLQAMTPADELSRQESITGPFDLSLVPLLTALAESQLAQGEFSASADNYLRAQHILHRAHGVNTLRQVPLVDRLIELSVAQNDVATADAMQHFRVELHQHHFGNGSVETANALQVLANWQQALGQFSLATQTYQTALSNLPSGNEHGRLRWQLKRATLHNQYLQGHCCDMDLLESGVEDLLADPNADQAERSIGLLGAADISLMAAAGNTDEAYARYAATTMEPVVSVIGISRPDRLVRAYMDQRYDETTVNRFAPGEMLGSPLPFCAARLVELSESSSIEDFFIDARLTVSSMGKVRKISILDSNAPRKVERLFKSVARLTRFRPHLEAGSPVDSEIRLKQTFSRQADLGNDHPAFLPAATATFQGCHAVAQLKDHRGDRPQLVFVQ